MVAHFTINGSQVLMQKLLMFMTKTFNQDLSALTHEPSFIEKLISLGAISVVALIITPIAGVLIYALRDLYVKKSLKQENFKEPIETTDQKVFIESVPDEHENDIRLLEPSRQKVFNWPVWVSIVLYIAFMLFFSFKSISVK